MPCEVPSLSFSELPSHPVASAEGSQKIYFLDTGIMYVRGTGAPQLFLPSQGVTPLAMTLLADGTQGEMHTTLGLVPGTDVQPYSADLTAFVTNASWSGANLTIAGNIISNGQLFGASLAINGNAQFDSNIVVDGTSTLNGAVSVDTLTATTLIDSPLVSVGSDLLVNGPITLLSGPTITTGAGVPASGEPDGSIYLRSGTPNGSLYVRQNGVWTLK